MGFFQTDETHEAATIKALKLQLREAEDVVRLKDQLNESLERQIANKEKEFDKLQGEFVAKESLLEAIRKEQVEFPISETVARHEGVSGDIENVATGGRDLLDRLKRYEDTWERLSDSLTCPICYQPFSAGKTVVLFCGHSFCSGCQLGWERTYNSHQSLNEDLRCDCMQNDIWTTFARARRRDNISERIARNAGVRRCGGGR